MKDWLLLSFLGLINLWSLILMGVDKKRAHQGAERRRISEASLLTFATLGGSLGILLGMHLWKHKTKKLKFKLGVPALLLVNLLVLASFLKWRF